MSPASDPPQWVTTHAGPPVTAAAETLEPSPREDARADAGTRVWTGRVSADGSYRIEVARQPDTGNEPLIYTMSVGLK